MKGVPEAKSGRIHDELASELQVSHSLKVSAHRKSLVDLTHSSFHSYHH